MTRNLCRGRSSKRIPAPRLSRQVSWPLHSSRRFQETSPAPSGRRRQRRRAHSGVQPEKKVKVSFDDEEQAIDWTGTFEQKGDKFVATFTDYYVDGMYGTKTGKGKFVLDGTCFIAPDKRAAMKFHSITGKGEFVFDFLPAEMVLYQIN